MSSISAARLRLSLVALLVATAFAVAAARAGGMPPEEEIDANGEPVGAASAPATDANPGRITAIPASFALATAPVAGPSVDSSSTARAVSDLAPSGLDAFRDHR